MAAVGVMVYRLFGGAGDPDGRHQAGSTAQYIAETLGVGVTGRKIHGPKVNGHYSFMCRVTSAFGATSSLTVWYSNLPDPDSSTDADWVQDTSITAVDLSSTGNTFVNVGNVNAEWIRFKVNGVTSGGSLWLYVRTEGQQNR